MALWGGSRNTIPEGICPTCQSILDDDMINFNILNEEIRDISIGNPIIINTFGTIRLKRCYMNHEHVVDFEWNGISFSCASCHTQLVNDRDTIRCTSCGYETDFNKLVEIYSNVVNLALYYSGFQTNVQFVMKYFDMGEGLRKWTDLLTEFFDSYRLNSVIRNRPVGMPEMTEYYSNSRIIHPSFKYSATGLLAYGGFSKIYLGKDMSGNYVVIKIPWGFRNESEKGMDKRINPYNIAVDKLLIESEFMQGVRNNPNFVEFIEEYDYDNTPHLVMKYLQGPTLSKYVKNAFKSNQPLPGEEVQRYIEKVMKVVRFIHLDMNKVHRDITPSNFIMVNGDLKMIDFGTISEDTGLEGADRTGIQAGGYHPPEQGQGVASKICDIYSLGSLMYFLVTGKDPPDPTPNTPTERVMMHEMQKVNIDKDFQNIIMKARSFSPSGRHQNINELYGDLVNYWYPDKHLCTICGEMTSKVLTFCEVCNSTICSNCGAGVRRESLACPRCNSLICPRCGVASFEGSKYCCKCGRGLQTSHVCERCNHPITYGAMFCKYCGEKVAIVV